MFCKTNHYKIGHYFEQLDPYDYETIEIVLKVMQNADEKNTNIQINQVCPHPVNGFCILCFVFFLLISVVIQEC